MKKYLTYFLVFIFAYLFFVIYTLPASVVADKVALPPSIQLQGLKGSIWQASVDQVITPDITVHDVKAQLSAISLLMMTPSVDIELGDPMKFGPQGQLTVIKDGDNIIVEDADLQISANELLQHASLPIPIDANGDIKLKVNAFETGKPICSVLDASATWPDANIKALDQKVKLGDLKAKLSCEQGALAIIIDDKNDLGLSYNAYMRQLGQVSGDGFIKPGAKFPKELTPVLSFLGKPDAQGRYRLSL